MPQPMRDDYVTIDGRTDWEAYQQDLAAWQAGPMLEEDAEDHSETWAQDEPTGPHTRSIEGVCQGCDPVGYAALVATARVMPVRVDDPWRDAVPVGTAPTVVPF